MAKKAAKRMVSGDNNPWRKKNESYGFMLAKSMIMMNAELHKQRMKPQNIYRDIGRDHWDYANDRVIGTGNTWNQNVMNSQLYKPRVQSAGRTPEDADDSLMRATQPTNARMSTGSFPQAEGQDAEQQVISYEDYNKVEELKYQIPFCRSDLKNGIGKLDDDYINKLKEHKDASDHDVSIANVFLQFLWMLNDNDGPSTLKNWEQVVQHLDSKIPDQLQNLERQIEDNKYDLETVDKLRNQFSMKSGEEEKTEKGLLHPIKEIICDAFCLVEILEELNYLKGKVQNMVSFLFLIVLGPDQSHWKNSRRC